MCIRDSNYGIFLASEDCYIWDNNISDNSEYGTYLNSSSSDNVIYQNAFTQNTVNAWDSTDWDDPNNNRWFQYPDKGNYWDDYNGTDSDGDGVGDVYYQIAGGNNSDFYPLGFFNDQPIADAGGPYQADINEEITFNATESHDPDGNIEGYRWDFNNDGNYDTNWLSTPIKNYTYESAGTYTLKLEVKDDENKTDTDTSTVTIFPEKNIMPVADANGPYDGYVNENITFDGSNSNDSDGTIEYYRWDWENDEKYDTSWLTSPTINKSFSSTGTHSVKLQVKDDRGATNSTITTVSINERQNNPPSKPTINGNILGSKNIDYNFTIVSVDPDEDKIRYIFYWNDSSNETYTEYLPSDSEYSFLYNWSKQGIYRLTVYAEDIKNATSDISEFQIFIDIDILFIEELNGYLLDFGKDGVYEKYYHNLSTPTNIELQDDGKYKIDEDGDSNWDYIYDPVTGSIKTIDEDKETKEKEDDNLYLILGLAILIIVMVIILVFIIFRKKIFIGGKKKVKKDAVTAKIIKGKCPSCGKEFSSYLSEENGFEFAVCNNCGKKLRKKKK